MADNENRTGERYYTTVRSLGTGTTSTAALMVWRLVTEYMLEHRQPMSGAQVAEATGMTLAEVDELFTGEYYQKYYGFRRFESLKEWRAWAEEHDVLYVPGKHDAPVEEEQAETEGDAEGNADGAPEA